MPGVRQSLLSRSSGAVHSISKCEFLGGVDKVPDPETERRYQDEAEEAVGGLVISGCQAPALFEL